MINLELGIMRHDANNPEASQRLIDWAMSNGINHFESCWFYMDFQCENFLYSKLTKYDRSQYYICGKMPIHGVLDNMDFKDVYKEQLSRVPGHYFDTYLLQALDARAAYPIFANKIIDFFLEEKKKGNIKRFGLSIQCTPEVFENYLSLKCWDVVQMPINYYDWFLCRYDENYALARKYNLPIIAQAPVKGGMLVNKRTSYFDSKIFEVYGQNLTEAAFNFIEQLDGIEMVLCGNSSLTTLQQTYNAVTASKQEIPFSVFKQAMDDYREKAKISCLKCGKCTLACPRRIPINAFIELFNLGLYDTKYFNALDILKSSPDEPNHLCNFCNQCVNVCPLNNEIPKLFFGDIFELRT